jgi:acetolactate synthase I/II/III large subunit
MNGAECLLRTLLAGGVDTCFMNPGTSEMQFVSALDRVPGMRPVLGLFEGVCSGAADGYARMTGKPAATLLHLGPGLANGLANFHNARKACSPIVSIVGEHATAHLPYNAPLKADTAAFAHPVSCYVRVLESAAAMGSAVLDTLAAALNPPGGIATLVVPADFSWSESGPCGVPGPAPAPASPDFSRILEAAKVLRSGEPAGLLLDGRVLRGPALQAAGRIAAATGARVYSNRFNARMERGAGRFSPERVGYFPEMAIAQLAGLRHLILVEAEVPVSFFAYPGVPGYVAPADCAVYALASKAENGTAALEALADELNARSFTPTRAPANRPALPGDGPLTPEATGVIVATLLPEGAIVSDEAVSASECFWPRLTGAAPHDHLAVTGGSIGQALPVAAGAAIAAPDRKVVAIEGDGSGLYTLQALWTMAREKLDVVSVILANRRYRILEVEMRRAGVERISGAVRDMIDIGRPEIDFVKLSEAFGVEASRATTNAALISQLRDAFSRRGPRLIEAVFE